MLTEKQLKSGLFSSETDHWSTPQEFYDSLNKEFNFNLDPCPLKSDRECLFEEWHGSVFVNPPYSNIRNFLEKGLLEIKKGNASIVVFLVPARTDTKWFHDLVLPYAKEIRFIKGRLRFSEYKWNAPFPSMIVVYHSLEG